MLWSGPIEDHKFISLMGISCYPHKMNFTYSQRKSILSNLIKNFGKPIITRSLWPPTCMFSATVSHGCPIVLIQRAIVLVASQNVFHSNILLFLFKLALDASFIRLKFKRLFYLERGNKGQFV